MQVIAKTYTSLSLVFSGYIAGIGDGILTAKGAPTSRNIHLFDATTMQQAGRNQSLKNGHYLFLGLDPSKEYLVMARDFKRELEPFAWDFVKPATDLTLIEQSALWQTWQ